MTLEPGRTRAAEAFKETANLAALTILGAASLLTLDWQLLAAGCTAEIAYLAWAYRSVSYQARLETRSGSGSNSVAFLDRVLLVVTVAGFVVIFFFGFGKHLLNHQLPYLTHAQGWETGAIAWTTLFLFYYLAKFRSSDTVSVNNVIMLLIGGAYLLLLVAAWRFMVTDRPRLHVLCVMLIGCCFFLIDFLSMKLHPDSKERLLSRASLIWADIPMVTAVLILLLYLLLHRDTEDPDVFVAGVVSCQLLISNVVFVVMEFGLLRLPPAPGAE